MYGCCCWLYWLQLQLQTEFLLKILLVLLVGWLYFVLCSGYLGCFKTNKIMNKPVAWLAAYTRTMMMAMAATTTTTMSHRSHREQRSQQRQKYLYTNSHTRTSPHKRKNRIYKIKTKQIKNHMFYSSRSQSKYKQEYKYEYK